MKKQKIQIRDIKRNHIKQHLKMIHSFLRRDFRKIKEDEVDSEKVFIELFGNVKIELWKLKAIYEYQL